MHFFFLTLLSFLFAPQSCASQTLVASSPAHSPVSSTAFACSCCCTNSSTALPPPFFFHATKAATAHFGFPSDSFVPRAPQAQPRPRPLLNCFPNSPFR